MGIMATYRNIVEIYGRYDDNNGFQPIILDYAVPSSVAEKDASKLCAVITYKARYFNSDGKMIIFFLWFRTQPLLTP